MQKILVIDSWKRMHPYECDSWQRAYELRRNLNKVHFAINRFHIKPA